MRKKEINNFSDQQAARVENDGSAYNGRVSKMFSLSLIIHLLSRFTDTVYNALINSFIGRLFTAYSLEETALNKGVVKKYFLSGLISEKHSRKIKQSVEKVFETSFFLNKIKSFCKYLLRIPLKTYGSFFICYGIYSLLVYSIRSVWLDSQFQIGSEVAVSAFFIFLSLPLMSSSESLGKALRNGRLTSTIFIDAFGFKTESFDIHVNRSKKGSNFSILFGMLAGLATTFITPMYLPIGLLILIFLSMLLVSPEIGIVISIFMIPFCSFSSNPSILIAMLVGSSAVSYIIKLLRGKRIFKIELMDLSVIAFMLIILMGGIITVGGKESFYSALISCILIFGFFCVVNLMRTEKWLNRCVIALISSSVFVALVGVLQYLLGFAVSGWVDSSMFFYIEGRATSLFDNPNVLAMYLVLTFPLVLAKVRKAKEKREKLLGFLSVISIVLCVLFTWSRGAWLALIISTILFFAIITRKTLVTLISAIFALPILSFIIPSGVVTRFLSIGNISDSSTYYRVYTWRGTLKAIKDNLFAGYGYGTDAFEKIYPQYAYAGMESAEHSHSLFLQILFGVGIFGLLIFFVFLFFLSQKNFEYFKKAYDKDTKTMSAAAFSAVVGALIMGLFDNIWYNYRIFFLFWIVAAISCAYIRFGYREEKRKYAVKDITPDNATIDIYPKR